MMQTSILEKLKTLQVRYYSLADQLSDEVVIRDMNLFKELSKEYASLREIVEVFQLYQNNSQSLETVKQLLSDQEWKEMAEEEMEVLVQKDKELVEQLKLLLLPKEEEDRCNVFLEIRAGAGGDEAAIFAGDLFRMYMRFVENLGWNFEIINKNDGEHGGYREIITRIVGKGVYAKLKFESGVHRVQRVPETEAQGRVHTSTCTVAVIPEAEEIESIEINPNDLKVDTFRSSGAGGQHVNKTDSAIRITHIPSGIVIECQDERSQHKNRARALSLLKAKLLTIEREKQKSQEAATRKSLVGTGDRSERIRTYNFPQGRLTDHRINLTLYQLNSIMEGNLDAVINPLIQEYNADRLMHFMGNTDAYS